MSNPGEAIGGAIALIFGGIIFLLFASELPSIGPIQLGLWGAIYVLGGAVLLVGALVATVTAFVN